MSVLLARPFAHECLIWVRAANYGQNYVVNVNGNNVEVETPVAPVVSSGGSGRDVTTVLLLLCEFFCTHYSIQEARM